MKKRRITLLSLLTLAMLTLVGMVSANDTGKTPAVRGEQPWMVALVDSYEPDAYYGQFCGGSLIAPEWVLTAAHCLEGVQSADEVDAVIGRYQLSSNEGERITAAEMFVHPGYPDYDDGQDNDIALIRLSRPATVGLPIRVVNVTNEYVDDPGETARVTGWGVLDENGDNAPDVLHGVDLPVVSQDTCRTSYGNDLYPDSLCAGYADGGADSCYGDSGGPLVGHDRNGDPVQIGVVSWGDACGAPGSYGVYMRLTDYFMWLNGIMAGSGDGLPPSEIPSEDEWGDEWGDDWGDEVGDGWEGAWWTVFIGEWWPVDGFDGLSGSESSILDLTGVVLPAGYTLDYSNTTNNELYATYSDEQGNYIDIYASPGEWEFYPEDQPYLHTIAGTQVLLDQESGEQIALFNLAGYGVEVYGTIGAEQMQALVQSLTQ